MTRILLAGSYGRSTKDENGDNLKYSCPATQLRRSVRRGTTVRPGRLDEGDRGATGFGRHSAPDRPTTQKEHDEQGQFIVTNTVLLTTSLDTSLWLRPDIYLGMF